jgi:predicted nucleic acid-binding protein
MGLTEDLGLGPIGLDTAIFIYYLEEHPRYLKLVEPIFLAIHEGRLSAVTSAVTLLETLVVPFRLGDLELARRYEELLTQSRGLRLIDLEKPLLRATAQLRAVTRVKTPDALQLTAALTSSCSVFLTNDRGLPDLAGMKVLQLEDYLAS